MGEINDTSQWTVILNGKVWTPTRKSIFGGVLLNLVNEVQRLRKTGPKKMDKTSGQALAVQGGIPKQVISCRGTESPASQVDRVYSQVAVSFTRDPSDKNFAGVHIWLTGYHGNNNPVLITDASDSPAVFLVETTGENVTVTVQPFNSNHVSAPFAGAKTCTVALDGAVSAPPAPSISSPTATITSGAVTVGQQFSFNYLPASISDVIAGYWIYRVGSHSAPTPPASRWKFVAASVNQSGVYTLIDSSGVSTNFYYVSAVNKQGLESSLTDATPSGGGGGGTTIYRPTTNTALAGGGFTNPANAYDGNATTYAPGSAKSGVIGSSSSWQGFSSIVGTPTAVKLKVTSQCTYPSGASGTIIVSYSTDNGSTYTTIYSTAGARATTTDVVTLSTLVNLTQVKVKATVGGTGTAYDNCLMYEIWVEVTT